MQQSQLVKFLIDSAHFLGLDPTIVLSMAINATLENQAGKVT